VSLCIILGLACLSASSSVFLVWERASASKHLQMVSGLHRSIFWAGVYTWDLLASVLPLALIISAFAACQVDEYSGEALLVIAAALGLFAASAAPLAYLLHWPFENNMACLAAQMGAYFFFGVAQLIAAVVLDGLAAAGVASAKHAWAVAQWAFRWLPHYNVGRILFNLSSDHMRPAGPTKLGPWHPDVSGNELLCMAAEAGGFMALTLAIEYGVFRAAAWKSLYLRCRGGGVDAAAAGNDANADAADDEDEGYVEDEGVRAERVRADHPSAPSAHSLVVRNLRKQYPKPSGSGGDAGKVIKAVKVGLYKLNPVEPLA
jgi:hypothetical protein